MLYNITSISFITWYIKISLRVNVFLSTPQSSYHSSHHSNICLFPFISQNALCSLFACLSLSLRIQLFREGSTQGRSGAAPHSPTLPLRFPSYNSFLMIKCSYLFTYILFLPGKVLENREWVFVAILSVPFLALNRV